MNDKLNSAAAAMVDSHEALTFHQLATSIDATLAERGNRYGVFAEHARITQNIKRAMADSPNWAALPDDKKEALEMLAHKMGRILNGDPNYHDSWHDIIGYTKLVADTLESAASDADPAAKESLVKQAQQWAEEAKYQGATVLEILRYFGLPEHDYEALTLIKAHVEAAGLRSKQEAA